MDKERVLSIDLSTKSGYACGISYDLGIKLIDYGTLNQIHCPNGPYPSSYIIWAHLIFEKIEKLIDLHAPDVLIIEETSKGSKNAMSQKILEFSHFLLAQYIADNSFKSVYIMTEVWRREIGCKMDDKEKLRNKEVRDYKKKNKTTIAYDINGKRTGLITKKHVNIRRVSEIFDKQLKQPLKRKDEDMADGLGLLACYHQRRLNEKKLKEVSIEDLVGDNI